MMIDWRSAMRDIVTGIETHARVTTVSGNSGDRVHTFAVYGALALIAAIVFGTLSYHPF
jgi:hypothetical protein